MGSRRFVRAHLVFFFILIAACGPTFNAMGVDRFPRPQFSTVHELPTITTPDPRASTIEYVDVAALAVALCLACYFVLKTRSRRGVLLLTIASLLYFGFYRKGCVCPIGSLQNVVLAFSDSSYVVPLAVIAFFMLPLVFALFFGRVFCAAVCPLGAIQDVVVIKPVRLPASLNRLLGTIPYIYLGLAVLMVASGIGFIICRFDPFVGFFRMDGPVPTLVFGAVLLIMGVFVARPYCRFLCPYGVLLGFMSRFSWRHATITPTDCIQCRLCEDSCPFDAIVKPTPAELPESREKGVRRLALIILAMPLAIGLGAWAASRLDSVVARADSRVAIAERVSLEDIGAVDGTILESDSFRETGESTATLIGTSLATRKAARIGGWILGGFVGAIVCMRLMGLSMYRKVKDYQPDRELCLSCARCFSSCPHEQQLRKERQRVGGSVKESSSSSSSVRNAERDERSSSSKKVLNANQDVTELGKRKRVHASS